MIRKVTKQTTVTPITKSTGKSTGSGVANMGKGKGKPMLKFERTSTETKTSPLAKQGIPSFAMEVTRSSGNKKATAEAGMPRFAMDRTVTKKTTKAKAKMLPEVTVTAKKPLLQFGMKRTVKKNK